MINHCIPQRMKKSWRCIYEQVNQKLVGQVTRRPLRPGEETRRYIPQQSVKERVPCVSTSPRSLLLQESLSACVQPLLKVQQLIVSCLPHIGFYPFFPFGMNSPKRNKNVTKKWVWSCLSSRLGFLQWFKRCRKRHQICCESTPEYDSHRKTVLGLNY